MYAEGDELWTEAAELGSIDALFNLGVAYFLGNWVQQDEAKAVEFYTKAARRGHFESRHNLGSFEAQKKGNHFRVSSKALSDLDLGENGGREFP